MPTAIEFSEPEKITLIETPDETSPGPGEALVRTHRMGICGTDIACYLGKFPFFSYPRTPGHELGLEVVAVGPDVENVKPGDRCSLEPYVNNPDNPVSKEGHSNCCPDVQVIGVHKPGGLRKGTFLVPARKLHQGNDLSYDQLALVETLAIGYHAVQRGNPQTGDTVLVIGAGPIGLACLEFLRLLDRVKILIMDMNQARLDFCQSKLGIEGILADGNQLATLEAMTNGRLANLIIDATGSSKSMSSCFEFAAFTGRVVYVGITTSDLSFPHAPVFHRRELTLLASRNALPADFTHIIELIRAARIDTDKWITHRIPFDEVSQQFASFTNPAAGTIKAIIEVS